MQSLYRLLAEKQIRVPRIITITRWLLLIHKLSENDLNAGNEVRIRPGKKEDLDFLASTGEESDPGYNIILQNMRWWNQYGFRCLYVGYLEDQQEPCMLEYWIEDFDNHRFKHMEYGGLYQPLDCFTVHTEGAYVRQDLQGKGFFSKFLAGGHKLLYQKGKKVSRAHVASSRRGTPAFKQLKKSGYVPDHWISRVKINLPFLRPKAFVHHEIKHPDRDKFPLTLY